MGLFEGNKDKDYQNDSSDVLFPADIWQGLVSNGVVQDVLQSLGLPGGWSFNIDQLMDGMNNGLSSRPRMPSTQQYSKCQEMNGLSVWDTKGLWRCLFPKSVAMGDDLSREDVEADKNHKLGLFFPDYTGYLSWRSYMFKMAKQKREAERDMLSLSTPEEVMMNQVDNMGRKVVGTSSYSTYISTDEGREKVKEQKTMYEDGSVLVKTHKKIFPINGEPREETSEQFIDSNR